MESDQSIAEQLDDEWRVICPEHHHQRRDKQGPTVYCKRCHCAYHYADLVAKREAQPFAVAGRRGGAGPPSGWLSYT